MNTPMYGSSIVLTILFVINKSDLSNDLLPLTQQLPSQSFLILAPDRERDENEMGNSREQFLINVILIESKQK